MDHKQSAEALYAAFNAHNLPGVLQLLSTDVEWNSFSVDWALAIGYFSGHAGVQDFFSKLVGMGTGQQQDVLFEPKEYYVSADSVHVIGIETGYLTGLVLGGTAANKPFFNNWDHTLWFDQAGLINRFRANYNLAQTAPTFWPKPR
jgi:ketosteroid isomerase-like protein